MSDNMVDEMWDGSFVANKLGVELVDEKQEEPFRKLLGLALRNNKKRAHLLVSKVLGKHVPVQPSVFRFAVHLMGEQLGALLDDRVPAAVAVRKKNELYEQIVQSDVYNSYIRSDFTVHNVTVFGYAETATGLGAAIADYLENADYVHSTRYPIPGVKEYGSFEESHSHATSHHITLTDNFLLDDDRRIVLVDDEITTGNTIMNTIRLFDSKKKRDTYYVATLTDLRTNEVKESFKQFEEELNITVHVVSLLSTELTVPDNAIVKAEQVISDIVATDDLVAEDTDVVGKVFVRRVKKTFSDTRGGVLSGYSSRMPSFGKLHSEANVVADKISRVNVEEKVLVLGLEETQYFPLLVAEKLNRSGKSNIYFSATTRSPVIAYNDASYAIKDSIKYFVPGDDVPRFVYNVGDTFDRIVVVTNDAEHTKQLSGLINELVGRTHVVEVVEAAVNVNFLAEPLTSPKFGSYEPEDVAWLLKDLSHAELEAPTEEREELIQSGRGHYAESLPVEYQPTEEYQQIFLNSLDEKKFELAFSVGVLAEQIHSRRNGKPVLVSLARAGTPVGVLLKRYLKNAYKIDVPHYAVSIVRGKGIDVNALNYLAANFDSSDIIFVDGWSGKGKITKELTSALDEYEKVTGVKFSAELAVVSDPAHCTDLYGTRDDFLIPSATLNSTVSGLISRTVLNENYINENDYHGAKFYTELADKDYSKLFVDTVSELFTTENIRLAQKAARAHVIEPVDWSGWATVEKIAEKYGIDDLNLVKPGSAETTRVLLRRVPELILIRMDKYDELKHIVLLAENRGSKIELVEDLPYASVGIIKPLKGETL